jgi:hypothetical protein
MGNVLSFVLIIIIIMLLLYKFYSYKSIDEYDKLESGMIGSFPSNTLNVYDSNKPIILPMENSINELIESFKENGVSFYKSLKNNKNSKKYKYYLTDDYKIQLLLGSNKLNDTQIYKYYETKNYISHNINELFNYHLDKIKYDKDNDYSYVKNWLQDTNTTGQYLAYVVSYVLSTTDIPSNIIILLKYKLSDRAKELLNQIITLFQYNYTDVLDALSYVLSPLFHYSSDRTHPDYPFWLNVYTEFTNNNITSYIIDLIKSSYMSEDIYYSIISAFISSSLDTGLTTAIKNMSYKCITSDFTIINTFPYNFTYILLLDAINENA